MYNRYIPQPDGSFQKSRITDPPAIDTVEEDKPKYSADDPVKPPDEQQKSSPNQGAHRQHLQNQPRRTMHTVSSGGSVTSFLKGLLPQNFDTEDLIVVLLLLLMSGGSGNDQNAALLTLGIYLFM